MPTTTMVVTVRQETPKNPMAVAPIAKFGGSTFALVAGGKKNIGPMVLDFMVAWGLLTI